MLNFNENWGYQRQKEPLQHQNCILMCNKVTSYRITNFLRKIQKSVRQKNIIKTHSVIKTHIMEKHLPFNYF